MSVKNFPLFLLVTLTCAACASGTKLQRTPEEDRYARAAMAHPTEFTVKKAEADSAWRRAKRWLEQNSSLSLKTETDYELATLVPEGGERVFAYQVMKYPLGDEVEFKVECQPSATLSRGDALLNAHLLAYFMKSGVMMPRFVVQP